MFVNTDERAKQLARDATIMIQQNKGVLKQIVLDDLEPRIPRILEVSTLPALREEARSTATMVATAATKEAIACVVLPRVESSAPVRPTVTVTAVQEERVKELQKVGKSGVVSSIRARLDRVNEETGPAPVGVGSLFAELGDTRTVSTVIAHVMESDEEDIETGKPLVPQQIVADIEKK